MELKLKINLRAFIRLDKNGYVMSQPWPPVCVSSVYCQTETVRQRFCNRHLDNKHKDTT